MELPRLHAQRRTGDEPFTNGEDALSITLRDFWCWSTSDLLNNTTRGVLAEFLVAAALGIPTGGVRDPWAAYDLQTADGLKIEVKSAAYLQSWAQKDFSKILFNVPETLAWDPDTNQLSSERVRQSHVYVFALLAHQDKATVNPLDVAQWRFYVVPTDKLNARKRSQLSITLASLSALSGGAVTFGELATAIRSAKEAHRGGRLGRDHSG